MQVIFESRDASASQLRDRSVQRVRFAFRRMETWVARVKVQLSDINGPRGGIDKRCQVEFSTQSSGPIVVVSLADDWYSALNQALERATRVLRRSWLRQQKPVRGRPSRLTVVA